MSAFFSIGTGNALRLITLMGDCPAHYWMFNSIPSLYPLGANSIPHIVPTKNISRPCQVPLLGKIVPSGEPLVCMIREFKFLTVFMETLIIIGYSQKFLVWDTP